MRAKVRRIARKDPLPVLPEAVVVGVDEAGRGALAGPVVTAAVILPRFHRLHECQDSKSLSPQRRCRLAEKIRRQAVLCSCGVAEVYEIDEMNVLQATLLAMSRSLEHFEAQADVAMIDGPHTPLTSLDCYAVIAGDSRVKAISCASILAKVARDDLMCQLHSRYPHYGFARNKGYATAEHRRALKRHGACSLHRKSFSPVRACINAAQH